MAKKRKPQQPAIPAIQPGDSAGSSGIAQSSWREKPFLPQEWYFGWISKTGYYATALLFVLLTIYFLLGYQTRPRILDRDLVARIMNNSSGPSNEIYAIGPPNSIQNARFNEKEEGLYFKCGGDEPVGFLLSRNLLNIPTNTINIGLSICNAYKGVPTFCFGFTNRNLADYQYDWRKLMAGIKMVSQEEPPSPEKMQYFVTISSTFYTSDFFDVPWNEAKYCLFLFTAPVPTELFLEKIIFVEKR